MLTGLQLQYPVKPKYQQIYTAVTLGRPMSCLIIVICLLLGQVMTPTETRRSAGHLFHEVNLVELANGPGVDNASWQTVSVIIVRIVLKLAWNRNAR